MSSNYSTIDERISMKYNDGPMIRTAFMEKLLSVAEAAARLGLHRTRINQLIGSGALPASRIGRAYVIREADLELVKERGSPGRPPKNKGVEKAESKKSRGRAKKRAK
jgi:excisionase family DNA binding protein